MVWVSPLVGASARLNCSILRAAGTAWFGSKAECAEMSRVEMGVGDFGYCPKCGNRAVVFDHYYDVECDWLDIWCAACGNYIDVDELCELYKALADPGRVTRILRTVLKDATDTLNFVDALFGGPKGSSAADWEELESVVEARELLDELDSRVAPPTSTATSYRIGDGPDAYWEDGRDE